MTGTSLIKSLEIKKTRSGKDYYEIILSNKDKECLAKIWGDAFGDELNGGMIIEWEGTEDEYKGTKQTIIRKYTIVDGDPSDYCDVPSPKEIKKIFNGMKKTIIDKFGLPYTCIVDRICSQYEEKIIAAPAATSIHHDTPGGLVLHTYEVFQICQSALKVFNLKDDLLLTSAFLHDMGKIFVYDENNMSYTYNIEGILEGHILRGIEIVDRVMIDSELYSNYTKDCLLIKHMIGSHHGCYEYGSPVLPAIKEAFVLHYADQISCKCSIVDNANKRTDGPIGERHGILGTSTINIKEYMK